jgi:hypothetical protein
MSGYLLGHGNTNHLEMFRFNCVTLSRYDADFVNLCIM